MIKNHFRMACIHCDMWCLMNSDNSTNIVFLLGRSPHLSKGWRFSFKAFKWPSDRQKQIHFRTHMVFICQISNKFYSTKNCLRKLYWHWPKLFFDCLLQFFNMSINVLEEASTFYVLFDGKTSVISEKQLQIPFQACQLWHYFKTLKICQILINVVFNWRSGRQPVINISSVYLVLIGLFLRILWQ